MPSGSKAPDRNTLERYASEGLTQQQMANRWMEESGFNCTRTAVAMALKREGVVTMRERPRYAREIPWEVSLAHTNRTDAQMLRLLGRKRAGGTLSPRQASKLRHFLATLEREDAAIVYLSDTDEGFLWIQREMIEEARQMGWVVSDPLALEEDGDPSGV